MPSEKLYGRSGIPQRFWAATLDDYVVDGTYGDKRAKRAISEYLEQLPTHLTAGRGICLAGGPGRGKTMLASIVGVQAIARGYRVGFVKYAQYLKSQQNAFSLKDRWLRDRDDEEGFLRWKDATDRLSYLRNDTDLLIVDDVGKEHATASRFSEDELDYLLRTRYDRGQATILTSNIAPREWTKQYADSLESFLKEACVLIPMRGADYRDRFVDDPDAYC